MTQRPNEIRPTILYIDDDPTNRTLVNRLLTSYNFRVIEAGSGIEGLQIARQNHPHLILMDINMPGLDGHETTTRMRSIQGLHNTPIVAVTANNTQGAREMTLAAGCDGYISKPIDIDNFPHQIISYLEGQRDTISVDERQHFLGKYSQRLVERLEEKVMALEEANSRLHKIDSLKSDFITIAAHELRTPITLVYGYARLLQSEVKDQAQSQAVAGDISALADQILDSVQRLTEVVNDILNISLIEADQMYLEDELVVLADVVEAALADLAPEKNHRILKINTGNLAQLPPVQGDTQRLQQVFWNMLSNAIKFTPDHGLIEITAQVEATQQSLIVTVKDTGIGIDPTEQKEIFERFYIVEDVAYHSTSKTAFRGGGMGLGLPIVRGIVEAHGGQIWVESQERDIENLPGSTFYVRLPLVSPEANP